MAKMESRVAEQMQDLPRMFPEVYKLIFENENVRVFELNAKPGEKVAMHSHPTTMAYFFNDIKDKWTFPDGKTQVMEMKGGQVIWSEPYSHAVEVIGPNNTHVLVVEFKKV